MVSRAVVDRAPGKTNESFAAHGGRGTTYLRLLQTVSTSRFRIVVWDFPPGATEGPHHHREDPVGLEHYLVVEGEVVIVIDGQEHHLAEGDAVAIPREAIRETRNDSVGEARLLLVFEALVE